MSNKLIKLLNTFITMKLTISFFILVQNSEYFFNRFIELSLYLDQLIKIQKLPIT